MGQEQNLRLTLPVSDVNTVISALGSLPYVQVAALIGTIHAQAQPQLLQAASTAPAEVPITTEGGSPA